MSASGAAGSAAGLAIYAGGGGGQQTHLGPGLVVGMTEVEVFERLNGWGVARDGELVDLRSSLTNTQTVVNATFAEARGTLMTIVNDFRLEAETMRNHSLYEATQNLARLDQVVGEARARFDAQDARVSQDLSDLAQRVAAQQRQVQQQPQQQQQPPMQFAASQGAAAAPLFVAAPTPTAVTSPGGTTRWYPGGPAAGVVMPPAPGAGYTTPPRSQQQQQQPQTPVFDAWASYRAGAAAAPQQPQQQPGDQPRHSYMTPGGEGGRTREMRLDARGWGANQPKLDIGVPADAFQIWKDRALTYLSRDRPDVRKLLCWAETQTKETLQDGLAAQAAHLGVADLVGVEYALHDGIKTTIMDTLLGRARNCVEHGCELWRSLCAEWSGAAPQLQMAKAKRFLDPPTCKNMQDLWSKLPVWERLGEEVASSGFKVEPWIQTVALDQLIPATLYDALTSRASTGTELKEYDARLAWVKVQMEHSRGLAQASSYGGRGKDASGDVNMYSVDNPPGLGNDAVEGMTWALGEAAQAEDWGLVDSLRNSIFAMKGAKGRKGFGKGTPGKGTASPAAAAKGGGTGVGVHTFDGKCNHCGHYGHRLSECRKRDAELGKTGGKGGPKGKAGGKGGATGGKGPAAPLAEVAAADDNWAGELLDGAIADAAAEFNEWNFDTAICSLAAGPKRCPETAARIICKTYLNACTGPVSGKTASASISHLLACEGRGPACRTDYRRRGLCKPPAPTKTQNRFAALDLLVDDADELLCAVSGGAAGGRVVEAVVDSGAVHSVTPPGCFPGRMVPSAWSKTGRGYRAANGTGIKNLGQIAVRFATAEGDKCSIPFQVAEVDQPLLSVAHLTAAGNRVELGHTDGRIVNITSGRSIALERRGGVYIMKMFLADPVLPAPFRRQGA